MFINNQVLRSVVEFSEFIGKGTISISNLEFEFEECSDKYSNEDSRILTLKNCDVGYYQIKAIGVEHVDCEITGVDNNSTKRSKKFSGKIDTVASPRSPDHPSGRVEQLDIVDIKE